MRLWLLLALWGCRDAQDIPVDLDRSEDPELVQLDRTRLLRRTSLELRGVLPSLAELEAVEADPDAFEAIRDQIFDDPRFEERLVQIYAQRWHTTVDEFHGTYYDYFLDPEEEYEFERAVGEEPLRLMAHIVASDLPWSEVVLADYSMANELLASIWPMSEYPENGEGWHPVHYIDGRPGVGVLASNGLWWRYFTTFFNQNRSRAAAISKLLLCEDLLNRPISFSESANLLAAEDVSGMVLSEPTCQGCHVTIEPLASTLFGFWWMDDYSAPEMDTYHPEREVLGSIELGVEPNYFGVPIAGFGELGHAIAADERFSRCAVESMAEALWHRGVELDDFELLEHIYDRFVADDLQVKSLIRDLTETAEYTAGALESTASMETADRVHTARLMDSSLFRSLSSDLTGLLWQRSGFDMLDNDEHGYRILGGGVDGEYVGRLQSDPSITWLLVLRRFSQALAHEVVQHDLVETESEPVLLHTTLDARPGDEDFAHAVDQLFFRLMGQRADEERLEGLAELWTELESIGGTEEAWKGVISVLIQDPDFVVY